MALNDLAFTAEHDEISLTTPGKYICNELNFLQIMHATITSTQTQNLFYFSNCGNHFLIYLLIGRVPEYFHAITC